jgi:hypothetical protein
MDVNFKDWGGLDSNSVAKILPSNHPFLLFSGSRPSTSPFRGLHLSIKRLPFFQHQPRLELGGYDHDGSFFSNISLIGFLLLPFCLVHILVFQSNP